MQERKKKWDQNGPTSKKWKKDDRKPKQERSASKRPARREGKTSLTFMQYSISHGITS